MNVAGTPYRTVWREGGVVYLIDQIALPHTFRILAQPDHLATAEAIRSMVVRGAGAIGATAGYAMAQAALEAPGDTFGDYVEKAAATVRATRPTAQNLFYAVSRVMAAIQRALPHVEEARSAACLEAELIANDDADSCQAIGHHGAPLMVRRDGGPGPVRVSTHCNAGWLAFVDWGSALSPVYTHFRQGGEVFVFVDETRPRGQGANLTAWELQQEGVPLALIADCATGHFLSRGEIDLVIVGSDRIANNGDVANKIGTYTRAVVAKSLGIPFYVAAPTSTIDPHCPHGDLIPIEERSPEEVTYTWGRLDSGERGRVLITAPGVPARNPAFDVTPAHLITGIITEVGVVPASPEGIRLALARKAAQHTGQPLTVEDTFR